MKFTKKKKVFESASAAAAKSAPEATPAPDTAAVSAAPDTAAVPSPKTLQTPSQRSEDTAAVSILRPVDATPPHAPPPVTASAGHLHDPFVALVTPWLVDGEEIISRTSPTIGRTDDFDGVRKAERATTNTGRTFTLDSGRFKRMGNLPAGVAEEMLINGQWVPACEPVKGEPFKDGFDPVQQ